MRLTSTRNAAWLTGFGLLVAASISAAGGGVKPKVRVVYSEMPEAVAREVSFEKDVRPILLENCTRCHGQKKQEGELRLDTADGIAAGSEEGEIVKAGESAASLLIKTVTGIGVKVEKVMPPKDDLLTKEEIGILRAWIDKGAKSD